MAEKDYGLEHILRIDSELNSIHDLDLLLERILLESRGVVNADAGSIYIKEGDRIHIRYSQNDTLQAKLPKNQKPPYNIFSLDINEKTISGYCALTGELINIPDVYKIPAGSPYSFNTMYDKSTNYASKSMLAIPLKTIDGNLLGVIQVINAKSKSESSKNKVVPFGKRAEGLVRHFASNAAVALQRARMSRAIMHRMIRMSELRDPKETGPHVNRVAGYAGEIYEHWAVKHGVAEHDMNRFKDILKFSAMLHDVGKVAISDVILKKPGKFTEEEYKIMQTHACQGSRLFDDPSSEYDSLAAEVALTHHCNWDGTGYPTRSEINATCVMKVAENSGSPSLKGEEIPLGGRITALADVYDALISRRVYKEPWEEERVLNEMRAMAGTKFDPELVSVFFEILPSIKQIRDLHPETSE
jgi:response regulator RpfG family c-di-GMP phosphodiesterase